MKWLLKILTGVQEGAETELLPGEEYLLGSSDRCDVVVLDSTLPEKALRIAVFEAGVKIVPQDGSTWLGERRLQAGTVENLPPCTVLTVGDLRLCVGEMGKPWPPLTWPALEDLRRKELEQQPPHEAGHPAPGQDGDTPPEPESTPRPDRPQPPAEETAPEAAAPDAGMPAPSSSLPGSRGGLTIRLLLLVRRSKGFRWAAALALTALALALTGLWLWRLSAPPPNLGGELQAARREEFKAVVERHRLSIVEEGGRRVLRGNLPDGAERRKVEYLAGICHPGLELDLSDDETLTIALQESLRGLTNGWVRLLSLKDRNARIGGVLETADDGRRCLARIKADIPRLGRLEHELVYADEMLIKLRKVLKLDPAFAKVAPAFRNGAFFLEGSIQEDSRKDFQEFIAQVKRHFPGTVPLVNVVKWFELQRLEGAGPRKTETTFANLIRGIIISPYPCLLLFDGSKCSEGGFLGDYVVESICPDEVVLRKGAQTVRWRP